MARNRAGLKRAPAARSRPLRRFPYNFGTFQQQ